MYNPVISQPSMAAATGPKKASDGYNIFNPEPEEEVQPQGANFDDLIAGGGPGGIIGFMAKHADAFPGGGAGGSISGSTSSAGKDLHNFFKGK